MTKKEQEAEIVSIVWGAVTDNSYRTKDDYREFDTENIDKLTKQVAKQMYNAGYRKADEVRKETANDVADWLLYRSNLGYPEYYKEIMQNIAKQICEKYGAETEK